MNTFLTIKEGTEVLFAASTQTCPTFRELLDSFAPGLRGLLIVVGDVFAIALILLVLLLIGSAVGLAPLLSTPEGLIGVLGATIAVLMSFTLFPVLLGCSASAGSRVVILAAEALGVLVAVSLGGLFITLLVSQTRTSVTGKESMVGMVGVVQQPVSGTIKGQIFVEGERWQAVLKEPDAQPLPVETEAEVTGFKREALVVRAVRPLPLSKEV